MQRWSGWLLALLLVVVGARAEDAFRDDFDRLDAWEAMPSWLGASAASHPRAEVVDGVAHFAVTEPQRGMKWRRSLDEVELEWAPWLVLRYRATGQSVNGRFDYLLWVDHAGERDGRRLVGAANVRADGAWHTQAFNLVELGLAGPLRAVALGCYADAAGQAEVWVDYLAVTADPPTDAEGYHVAAVGPGATWPVDLTQPDAWTVQPNWLGNFGPQASVRATPAGLRFDQPDALTGAKWSCPLPEPVRGAGWLALRYRARGLSGFDDYALHLGGAGGGEQQAVKLSELCGDGGWHVARARLTVAEPRLVAVQVQAARADSWLELGGLTFSEREPNVTLDQVLDYRSGWPATLAGWRPVALPPGQTDGPALLRLLDQTGWCDATEITTSGVPFRLGRGPRTVLQTPFRAPGDLVLPLDGRAAELYLLLGVLLPRHEEPSYHPAAGGGVDHVHRFVAQVEYADGTVDEQFPYSVTGAAHRLWPGLGTYSLALEPGHPLRRVVLHDRHRRGALALVAATLADAPGPATAATQAVPATPVPPARPLPSRAVGITVGEAEVTAVSRSLTLVLDRRAGLRVSRLIDHAAGDLVLSGPAPEPLFSLEVGGRRLTSADFQVAAVAARPQACRLSLVHEAARVDVTIDVDDERELGLQATCAAPATRFVFPLLPGVSFSPAPADNWYWLPKQGSVVSSAPVSVRARYAGAGNPAQVMGAFCPRLGTGLYLLTQDLEALPRVYQLDKRGSAVGLGVAYEPFRGGRTPRTVVGCHSGGWQAQLARYREWVDTWYRPAAPRKAWFREVFNFRQQFLHFGFPKRSGLFDAATRRYHFQSVLDADAAAFDGVDYLHLFDWGWDPQHGRCGEYRPWDYLGGAEQFRRELAALSVPVGLYLEGYLVDPPAAVTRDHGADWQLLNAAGKPYTNYLPSLNMCPAVPGWQDYLTAAYARVQRETGARGYYLDEFGFSAHYDCYQPAHGHPVPATPVLGERELLRKVRAVLGPEAAVYTEECPTDVNSQYQDGSFTYGLASGTDTLAPTRLNLYRFLFPTFKTFEIIVCDQPLGDNVEAVKRVLFNGEGIWLEGSPAESFTPDTRAAIARSHRVLRANRECFAGDYPQPLVPTRYVGVYANRFASRADEGGKTVWTVYNTNYRTARGGLLAVHHTPGAVYRDEVGGLPLTFTLDGDQAVLQFTLAPRDVTVVSRVVASQGARQP